MADPGAPRETRPGANGGESGSDLLAVALLIYFVALIVIVAALLLVPVLL